jgi:hypothetical protein
MNKEIIRNLFELLSNTRKLLWQLCVIFILGSASLIAMDEQQVEPKLATYLWRHNIDLTDNDTWPNKQVIDIDPNISFHAIRLKCDPTARKFTLSLEKESFGDVIIDLLTGEINNAHPFSIEHTFIIKEQPYFLKFSVNPEFKVTFERVSTPISFYMTSTNPIVVQNGGDDIFGLIESRNGSIFLGARKDVLTGYQQAGDCTFKPIDPELLICSFSQFDNNYGGVFAPEGKILVSAQNSISNGKGIETEVTTLFTHQVINVTFSQTRNPSLNRTHKFYMGGNGSFMRCLSRMMLNSNYISNLYNDLEVTGGDILLQGPRTATIKITGNVNTPTNMWVMAGCYDVRQDREDVMSPSFPGIKVGEISLSHNYPKITMGWDHYIRCDNVYINHPSGGWQPHIVKVGSSKEYGSNYDMSAKMSIKVDASNKFYF